MQRLLNGAGWDADGVRDDLREYVVEHLGDPAAVLVLNEAGFVKKGTHSAGVARQYTGTAGRIENAQVGVFLAYAALAGVALIDRDLYLPKVWTDDRKRCRAAGIGDQVAFQTKPQLAQAMLQRAVETRVPFEWVTGDSVYGADRRLRRWLEQHAIPHVLAVKRTEPLLTMTDRGPGQVPAEQLLAQVEPAQWLRLSAGQGSKGRRLAVWLVRVPLWRLGGPGNVGFWLLARRSISDPTDLACYVCSAPAATSLATLVRVAGCRWWVEEAFEQAKGEVGLDHYQVGSTAPGTGTSLSRWPRTTSWPSPALSSPIRRPGSGGRGRDPHWACLSRSRSRNCAGLLVRLVWSPPCGPGFTLGWSVWRRRHQATGCRCHYQRQRTKLRL